MIALASVHAEGRQAVLQRLQFEGALGADDVGPGREELPELDVAGPQALTALPTGGCCGSAAGVARAELRQLQAERARARAVSANCSGGSSAS